MELLLDQGLPRSVAPLLHAAGHNVVHVGDIKMANATDVAILAEAVRRLATVITIDADFHALLALSRATGPSVVRLRVQGLDGPRLAKLILGVIAQCQHDLLAGAVVTADLARARVHRLPLVP